eukprot:3303339-Alexandrium_andersonii.AAC.1
MRSTAEMWSSVAHRPSRPTRSPRIKHSPPRICAFGTPNEKPDVMLTERSTSTASRWSRR